MTDAKVVPIDATRQAGAKSNAANHAALRKVRALVIGTEKSMGTPNGLTRARAEPGASQAIPEEPFAALGHKGKIIIPPFDMFTLAMLPENSSELNQCVQAMETNIDATGHRFVSRLRMNDITPTGGNTGESKQEPDDEVKRLLFEAKKEKVRLTNFFLYATGESYVEFRRRLRRDLETTGNAYFEVIRNEGGKIQGFQHLPSYQMRLGKLEEDQVEATRKILELQVNDSVRVRTQKVIRRFRTFVQSRQITSGRTQSSTFGSKVVWFKEFGDERLYSKKTGELRKRVPLDERATEVIHMKQYSPRTPYGLPRYIGNLLSIFGDRASEEINFTTFKNNNIPSMVVAVSNGQLTDATVGRIESFVDSTIQGSDNMSKFLIIEAENSEDEEGEDGGQVKIDVQPLTGDQHTDAMFQNYSKNNQDKVRRAYRLPPIFVGVSSDYTRATADSSRRLADEQIFAPERNEFDDCMNRLVFPDMGIIYHKYKSNSPNTTDNAQLVKILGGAEKTGGMTPRIARNVLEDILGIDLPDFAPDFPADAPFSLTMADAVKNKADPTEPGQQVTAIKTLKALGILGDDNEVDVSSIDDMEVDLDDPESVMDVAKRLLAVNRAAEILWRDRQGIAAQ